MSRTQIMLDVFEALALCEAQVRHNFQLDVFKTFALSETRCPIQVLPERWKLPLNYASDQLGRKMESQMGRSYLKLSRTWYQKQPLAPTPWPMHAPKRQVTLTPLQRKCENTVI
jgi:hypothetical protein